MQVDIDMRQTFDRVQIRRRVQEDIWANRVEHVWTSKKIDDEKELNMRGQAPGPPPPGAKLVLAQLPLAACDLLGAASA